ncbi:phosphoribosylformylglycinamidine synthase subunit PurS [Natronogracilivirga saccharolytica]|uniref:Phosphoribosylformylglycinamidine synthase subunit PurS n=1 Tax=Natronogracilivirga saccharolytica TaxID=2812953 RepID=A0A8J7RPJ9_9BACT|nr:phosphoribosylformylglycinamidine synthase subunit PurS [Natronogracilivirga saccharolytica]MBP3191519.1 phosphoribosylformylglycinamidine synthase subunit PurS [Natronogracilivirga saccharolytica]
MQVEIIITLRESILDPKGKASHHALENLGFEDIKGVRIGKFIQLEVDTTDPQKAREVAREASEKLLANTVMENYEIRIPDNA